jgi:iron complex transport system permease protein
MTPAAPYKRYVRRRMLFLAALLLLLLPVAFCSLVVGSAQVGVRELYGALWGEDAAFISQLVWGIRLPRMAGALLAGMALSVSGAVMQSLLRNPLASPYTLGISGAASFGASWAIVVWGGVGVALSAFGCSLGAVGVILLLARYKGSSREVIILSGIVLTAFFAAGVSALQYFGNDVQLATMLFWSFGDLGRARWDNLAVLAAVLIPALLFFFSQAWRYKSLQSGDDYARSLGVRVGRLRLQGMVVASLVTATVVSFYGVMAFVGLVVPHIIRRLIGSDEPFLLPASALFGGVFLLLSDLLSRVVLAPVVLPVGILTSFMGAPLFLFLLIRGMNKRY